MKRRQDVSVVRLHDVLLERCDDASKGCNKDGLLLRLHNVSNRSHMKHQMTPQWYVTKTCLVSLNKTPYNVL